MPTDPAPLVLTQALAHRMEAVAVAFGRIWLGAVEGLEIGDFGPRVLAACHPDRPALDFQNRVNGLVPADAPRVTDIGRFYDDRSVRPWWELVPDDDFGVLADALSARGARQIGFHGFLFGPAGTSAMVTATEPEDTIGDVEIEVVEHRTAFATFAATRTAAHELPVEVREQAAADLGGWFGADGVTLLLARVAGAPAATAALFVHDGIGYLADAATHPDFRRRGLQSLLVAHRRRMAADAGCGLVCSQASFAGASHRNLQRRGLTAGFTKVVWR